MKEETPNKISWTNPSIGVTSNSNLNEKLNESNKIINELQNEVKVLQDKITKLTSEDVPTETKEVSMDLPFESPFTEFTYSEPKKKKEDAVQSILESVKEEVKDEPKEEQKTDMPTFSQLLEAESKEDRLSIVVNRYNTDIEAITKGKGAKFISLSEAEHTKLQTGKIN
ncbi:MAG: hypothetical protein IKP98_04180 [Bacilli bacterium]|nr:hypothetical protein [Bacilli bacterium]